MVQTVQISEGLPSGIKFDCASPSDTLLLVFSGWGRDCRESAGFDFVSMLSDLKVKKVFLRDPLWTWYHLGIPGVGENIEEVARFIQGLRTQEQVKRVVTIGHCGGGYGAILFGLLGSVDAVYAISPHTFLLTPDYITYPERLQRAKRMAKSDDHFWDLRPVYQNAKGNHPKIFLFYPKYSSMDSYQAQNLMGLPTVQLLSYPYTNHNLARLFRKRGILHQIIRSAASGDAFDPNRFLPSRWNIIRDILSDLLTPRRRSRRSLKMFVKSLVGRNEPPQKL